MNALELLKSKLSELNGVKINWTPLEISVAVGDECLKRFKGHIRYEDIIGCNRQWFIDVKYIDQFDKVYLEDYIITTKDQRKILKHSGATFDKSNRLWFLYKYQANKEVLPIEEEILPIEEVLPIEEILPIEEEVLPIEEEVLPPVEEILPRSKTDKQLLKQKYNRQTYLNRKISYKIRYIFKTYPYIRDKHSVEIKTYLQTTGGVEDNNLLDLLQSFIVYKETPTIYKTKNRLPRVLREMMK